MGNLVKKILIVDDDRQLQQALQQILADEGYETHHAENGQMGLQLAKSLRPALIMLDIMLPGGPNGMDVLGSIKADKEILHIPVIMMSNLATQQKEAKERGASAYIIKAVMSIDEITDMVKQHA
jgi:DNA-binding response OmpR family regulator